MEPKREAYRDALRVVVKQHLLHEVNAIRSKVRENLVEVLWLPLGVLVPAGEGVQTGSEAMVAGNAGRTPRGQKQQQRQKNGWQHVPVPELADAWPSALVGGAECLEDVEELLEF